MNAYGYVGGGSGRSRGGHGVHVDEREQIGLVRLRAVRDIVVADEALEDGVVEALACREDRAHHSGQVTALLRLYATLNELDILSDVFS